MGLAALIGMIVGIIGIGLIYVTFRATRRAARAAEEALDHGRETASRQLRAYVTVKDVEVRDLMPGGSPRYVCTIKNWGQTPAFRVRSVVLVRASRIGPEKFRIRFRKGLAGSPAELGPGEEIHHWSIKKESIISEEEWGEILSGKITLIFAGYITYYDAFGRFRRTIFRRYVEPKKELDTDTGFAGLFFADKGNRSN